jgi:hypothetical protein
MQPVCPQCGKRAAEESPLFCSGCGARMDGSLSADGTPVAVRPRKNAMTAAFCSSCLPGLGQVYNGETAKGYLLFLATLAGLVCLLLPGLLLWVYATYDAWGVAGRMNAGEIEYRETRTLPLVTFVVFALVAILVVLLLVIAILVAAMMAALGPLSTGPGSTSQESFYRIFLP